MKKVSNYRFMVDSCDTQDRKLLFGFEKHMKFDEKAWGNRINREKSLNRLLKSAATITASLIEKSSSKPKTHSLEESKTGELSSDHKRLCDGLGLSLPEKKTGKNSTIFNEENNAIADKILQHESISPKERFKICKLFGKLRVQKHHFSSFRFNKWLN